MRGAALAATVVLALLAGAYVAWSWSDGLADFGGDNAYYLLLARFYSPFAPADAAARMAAELAPYPPGYPIFLALTGGADSARAAHAASALAFAGGFAMLALWLVRAGLGVATALAAAVCVALLPGTYIEALHVRSEGLYLALSLGALAALTAARERDRRWWACALAIALACAVRTAGLALAIAFVLVLIARRPRHAPLLAALALVPGVAWVAVGSPEGGGYLTGLLREGGSFGGIVGVVSIQLQALSAELPTQFNHGIGAAWPAWTIAALGVLGALVRAARLEIDGLYALGYGALIVLWPYPAEAGRFLVMLIPVLLGHALLLVAGVLGATQLEHRAATLARFAVIAIAVLPALPAWHLTALRLAEPLPSELESARRTAHWYHPDPRVAYLGAQQGVAMVDGLARIDDVLADHDPTCVLSAKPSLVAWYSGLPSWPPPRASLSDAEFERELAARGCRHAFVFARATPSYPGMYPLLRIRDRVRSVDAVSLPGPREGESVVAAMLVAVDPAPGEDAARAPATR